MSRNWDKIKKRRRKKAYIRRLKVRAKTQPKSTHKPHPAST